MTDFQQQAAHLKKLAGILVNAAKAGAQGKLNAARKLDEAARLAAQFDWPKLVEELKHACEQNRALREASLQSRRNKLLHAARAAGEPFDEGARTVRVGIFRLALEGETMLLSSASYFALCPFQHFRYQRFSFFPALVPCPKPCPSRAKRLICG